MSHLIDHQLRMCFGTCNLHHKFRNRYAKDRMSHVHNCTTSTSCISKNLMTNVVFMYKSDFPCMACGHLQFRGPILCHVCTATDQNIVHADCERLQMFVVSEIDPMNYIYITWYFITLKKKTVQISREETIEISKFRWNPFMLKFVYI